jgi:hypothetical protein
VLSSQSLLLLGVWAPWRVTARVAVTTIALVWVPTRMWTEVKP